LKAWLKGLVSFGGAGTGEMRKAWRWPVNEPVHWRFQGEKQMMD